MNRYFFGGEYFKTPQRHINLVNPIFIEKEFRGVWGGGRVASCARNN